MRFLKYFWNKEIKPAAIGCAVVVGMCAPFMVAWLLIPANWKELINAVAMTSCMFGVPSMAAVFLYLLVRDSWREYKRQQSHDERAS